LPGNKEEEALTSTTRQQNTDKFSDAIVQSVAKLAGINLRKFGSFSYWFDKP
jgi:nucleoid DNA-binding protein